MKKVRKKKMSTKKVQSFSLLEIIVSISILVLISALLGVKVVDLIGEHRFKSSVQAFADDLKQLQVLSVSHGSDFSIYLYLQGGAYYYECISEAELKIGPLYSRHLLKGVSSVSIGEKKQESVMLSISSTGKVDPTIALGFHLKEIEGDDQGIWLDLRQPLTIALTTQKPKPLERISMPSMPKIQPSVDK